MTGSTDALPALRDLDQLVRELAQLPGLPPLERARKSRELAGWAREVLGLVGDEAVWLATNEVVGTRRPTHQEVADLLGVSAGRVSNAITGYRRWATRESS